MNEPINALDSDGFDAIWIQEAHSAGGNGHSGLLVQNDKGDWYYFYWGPQNGSTTTEMIFGVKADTYFELIGGPDTDMSTTESIKKAIRNKNGKAATRADNITETFYFEGDYTNAYYKADSIKDSGENYELLTNNCVQKTLSAFMAADDRFAYVSNSVSSFIPNNAALKVALLPKKKSDFPWLLYSTNAFSSSIIPF